jgi:hypothetical protein
MQEGVVINNNYEMIGINKLQAGRRIRLNKATAAETAACASICR